MKFDRRDIFRVLLHYKTKFAKFFTHISGRLNTYKKEESR